MQHFQVVDLFCGIGGLTKGLENSGLDVIAGFDSDSTCKYAYESNNKAKFYDEDIKNTSGKEILSCYGKNCGRILVGCAPCQPFSQMRFKLGAKNKDDEKYGLLSEFGRIIEEVDPTIVSMENVPSIGKTEIYRDFLQFLKNHGYHTNGGEVVRCSDYGVPQNRRRFVLLASKLGEINLVRPSYRHEMVTVRHFIGDLPPVNAGAKCQSDRLHQSAKLSKLNLERIMNSKPGGTWKDWPVELRCTCHRRKSGETYKSVYGRMEWDEIGPTITTEFYCYGTGRFGHPDQNRALTLREGALLQTFPREYKFVDPKLPLVMRKVARHIGNAVPVKLGEAIGASIKRHLEKYGFTE